MKNSILFCILACIEIFFGKISVAQTNTFPTTGAAGIGTTVPNASSILEVKSTTKGVLVPRMTKTQRDAIASPAQGLLIYQTNSTPGFYYFEGSWTAVTSKSANKSLSNLTVPTAVNVDLLPGTNNTLDIGSSSLGWKDVYANGSYYLGGNTVLSIKGTENTFVGANSGTFNTTGSANAATGNSSLYSNTTGSNNTANGQVALYSNTTGGNNTATGPYALGNNTIGFGNTGDGYATLLYNVAGSNGTALGMNAMYYANSTSTPFINYNVAIGFEALRGSSAPAANTGNYNTSLGYQTLLSNSTGSLNTATGSFALYSNTTGSYNIANGDSALYFNTTGGNNTANGRRALYSNTTGSFNTANGSLALYSNTTGISNTANGAKALYSNTTAQNNTANGYYALYYATTGGYNTANGQIALFSNTTGDYNTAIGAGALYFNTTGRLNAATGEQALYSNTTGFNNTATGEQALYGNITGSYNSAFGQSASFSSSALANTSCMGYNSGGAVNSSNRIELGNTSVSVIAGQVSFSTYSDERIKDNIKEDVPGLAFISKLRPVTYNLNIHKENAMVYKGTNKDEAVWDTKYDIEKIKMTGFLAQDVEMAAKETGYDFSGVQKPANPEELYSLRYSDFVMPLVKAVQELSNQDEGLKMEDGRQKSKTDSLQFVLSRFSREVYSLQKENMEMKNQIAQLQSSIENIVTLSGVEGQKSSMTDGFVRASPAVLRDLEGALLGQNIPNPFDNSTLIPFRIPKDCKDASIMITNTSTSEVISVIPISCNEDHLSIDSGVLASGTYSYSLYVDGTLIQTRQMALTK